MKTMFKFFAPMAVAALALVACQRESSKNQDLDGGQIIRVHASAQDLANEDTRTYIDTYEGTANTILWGTGEYMKLCITSVAGETTENKWATSTDDCADLFEGDPTALFEFSVTPQEASSYLYQGLYPASAAVERDNTNPANYKVNLPATQNATASSYDPAAYIMVAKPETFESVEPDWLASYRRATALNKITLKNVPSGVSIKRVTITVPTGKYLAGARHFNLSTGESGDIYSGGGRTETVEVKFETPLAGGANIDIWFTSWEVVAEAGETVSIVAFTTDKKSYTKTITVPAGKTISFKEGYLNTLGANMSGITPEDVTEMEEGSYVVLAKDGTSYYALKAEKDSGKERLLSVDYNGDLESYLGDADIIWNLTKSGDSFIFENDGKYLGYKGSSNESYWLADGEDWTTTNYLLDVTAQETAGLYYVTVHSNSSRYLSKNSSDAFFAFYGNTGQKADIVFVPATIDEREVLTLSFEEEEINLTTANYEEFEGQVATPSVQGKAVTYSWDADDTFGLIDENDGTVELAGIVGSAVVTASFAGDENYRPATASYTITVSSASGPQYELVSTVEGVVEGDYIITWDNKYYLPSGSTSGTNPAVGTGITVASDKITNTVTSDMVWTFTGDNTDGFTISDGTNILHSTNAAQGISITTTSTRKWKVSVDGTYGMLLRGDDGGTRNLAVYNSGSWRYYATGNNYTGTLRLYKLSDTREEAGMSWSAESATASWNTGNTVSGFTPPTLTQGHATGITYESTDTDVATVSTDGVVTIVGPGETTIKAIFEGDSNYKPQTVSYALTVTDDRETVATPVINPASGTVASGAEVTISCSTNGAAIHYTLDGTAPTAESTTYTDAIILTESKTIKAIAIKDGYKNSAVATANLTVGVVNTSTEANPYTAAEAAALAGQLSANGTLADVYVSGIISEITDAFNSQYNNVSFKLSEDGLTTGTQLMVFRIPAESADDFVVGDAVEIKGTLKNYQNNNQTTLELTAEFTLIYRVHAPKISPNGGNFTDTQTVTITAEQGATIRYTVDGNDPTETVGSVYSDAITLNETKTVKAVAIIDGIASGVVSATFTKSNSPSPETITFANLGLSDGKQYSDPFNGGHFTITFRGGANDGKYYNTGSGIRTYGGGSITIASSQYKIKEISFTWDGSNAPTSDVANPSGYSTTTNKWVGASAANSVVLTRPSGSGHWRLKSVTVTYE